MAFIDIGNPAIIRDGNLGCINTHIDFCNPANASGTIISVELYAQETLSNCEVATFYEVSAGHFTTRDHWPIGNITAGAKRTFTVILDVQAGDYIGLWYTAGKLEMALSGGNGYYYMAGDQIPCTNQSFVRNEDNIISLFGRSAYIAPTVTTQAVSNIGSTTATGNGTITSVGSGNVTKRGICWSKTGNPTISNSKSYKTGSFGTGSFSRSMTGLSPGVLYYVRAYAYNDAGYSYGSQVTFTTNKVAPTVTTRACTNVTGHSATGKGNITARGGENATTRGFCYMVGTSGNPTTANSKVYDTGSFGTGAFSKTIPNLSPGTNYRVRAYAINSIGTGYGATVQLTTDIPPTVTTQAVTEITHNTATGNGNITATGGETPTKRGVCWNTTGSPTVADSKSEQTGSFGTGTFTRPITGLDPGVKYYVKAYAYSSAGYGYGGEVNFTTDKIAPTVTVQALTDVMPTTVTANGNITSLGGENTTHRGFKYGLTKTATWDAHDGPGSYESGAYTKGLIELTANTTYWIQAYATNSIGTSYSEWIQFQTAAVGIIPTGTKIDICSDSSGYSYQLQRSETDDGEAYTAYFVISTDLTDKQALAFYKRILDLHLYFRNEDSGAATIEVKRDSEAEWQPVGSVSLEGDEDVIVKHLATDIRAKHFLFKISSANFFRFLGCLFEYLPEDMR